MPRQLRQCLMNDRELFERLYGFTVRLEVQCAFVVKQKYYGRTSLQMIQFTGMFLFTET